MRYEISNKTLVFDNQGFKLKKERLNYIKVFSKLVLPNRLSHVVRVYVSCD